MKKYYFCFVLFVFFVVYHSIWAEEIKRTPVAAPTTKPTKSPSDSVSSSEISPYHFQSKTVWGELNVSVQALQDQFNVEVKSNVTAAGWILKNERTNRTVSKGGLNSSNQFQFKINQSFHEAFRLIVFLNSEREQVPVVIHLSPVAKNQTEAAPTGIPDDFQENLDHPYHSTVKNLYDKAALDSANGDNSSALENLRKAEKLDPTQPQIQTLLRKIKSTSNSLPDGLLTQAQLEMNKGSQEEALAKVMDYLDQHPNDEKGLKLKDEIEEKNSDLKPNNNIHPKSVGKVKTERKKDSIKPVKIKLNNEDSQAQADQTYNLGLEFYRKNDFAGAKKLWEQTLQILPTHLQAQRNLQRLKDEHPDLP